MEQHEVMEYDVVIVGAGPSGLAAGIRLKQRAPHLHVCILEKGGQIGAHLLSGAVLNPCSLKTLLPEYWQEAPLGCAVTHDAFYYLTSARAFRLPTPKPMKNHGNRIISLGELGQFLAEHAQRLGCEIYSGFAATDILYNDEGTVIGVKMGDLGVNKQGEKTARYQAGLHLHAKQTLFAEGCRGQLSEKLMVRFNLRQHVCPQTYGLGIKEIWQVLPKHHREGDVMHTVGWPLDRKTYGGSFLYHLPQHRIALGFVVGLDYQNTWLSPFEEMQRFKTHPLIRASLKDGERIAYGARALNEGGWQSLPKLTFPGGALVGDAAGFLNVPQIKGIHLAIQSGLFAADACVDTFAASSTMSQEIYAYNHAFKQSWMAKELYAVRNIRPGFRFGLLPGMLNAALETYVTRGYSPWTLKNHADHATLKPATEAIKITYPKPDGILTFDKLSSVYLTNTHHEENQPVHLQLRDLKLAIDVNYQHYASPETRYCPAGVYEILHDDHGVRLQINAQNCIHCKTCDIKDPKQNIVWCAPEGGGGPHYVGM